MGMNPCKNARIIESLGKSTGCFASRAGNLLIGRAPQKL
jgi:hypothetical protein